MNIFKLKTFFTIILMLAASSVYASPLHITVSIVPQEYFVKKIGGDLVKVSSMVRSGSNPATYEPQPKQMTNLSRTDIYFSIGVPFERAWLDRFKSANPKLNVVNLEKTVTRQPMQAHSHDDHGEHDDHDKHNEHFTADPHIWLSPPLVRILSMKIRDALIAEDPVNRASYMNNYFKFAKEIDQLDSQLIKIFADKKNELSFIVYHPSWGYFARAYGLTQIPIELEGKEPSPKELARLVDYVKKNTVSTIFIQPQFSRKSAEAIAASVGINVQTADPLAADWPDNLKKVALSFVKNAHQSSSANL